MKKTTLPKHAKTAIANDRGSEKIPSAPLAHSLTRSLGHSCLPVHPPLGLDLRARGGLPEELELPPSQHYPPLALKPKGSLPKRLIGLSLLVAPHSGLHPDNGSNG